MTAMPHLAAMAWDHADRLQHCDLGGGGDVWFVYDAAGNRVRKVQVNTSGSTVRERIYVGAWEVWRERIGTPLAVEQERQTLHVGDDRGKLALVETLTVDDGDPVVTPTSTQRHQHGRHLGSASLELDANAAVISYEEFHPFGTSSYAANDSGIEVSAKRYRYIGKERDEETGLYHLGARYYASWLGRWTAADPIGLGDGVNRYAYTRGNPVRLADPSGRAGATPDLASAEAMGAWITSELAGRAAKAHAPPSERETPQQWSDRVQSEKSRRSVAAAARRNEGEVETSPQAYAAARVFFGVASAVVPGGWVVRGLALANAADEVTTGVRQAHDPDAKSVKARTGEAAARALGASESTAQSVGAAADVLAPLGIGVASVVGVGFRAASTSFGRAVGSAVDDAFAGTAQAVDELAPRVSIAAEGGAKTLARGTQNEMLRDAVAHVKGLPGAERVAAFRQLKGQIEAAHPGSWEAAEAAATNGTMFVGTAGRTAAFDATGRMFVGDISNFAAFKPSSGGKITINFDLLREIK